MITSLMICFVGRYPSTSRRVSFAVTTTKQNNVLKWNDAYSTSSTAARMLHATYKREYLIGKDEKNSPNVEWEPIDVPLVFVPGMKGTHLSFEDSTPGAKKKRVWLTLSHLLNIPPRPDGHPARDLSLPLTYDNPSANFTSSFENDILGIASRYPKQNRGNLVPDGIVDHIIEFNVGNKRGDYDSRTLIDMNFLPFYGHATKLLREMNALYNRRRHRSSIVSLSDPEDEIRGDEVTSIVGSMGKFIEHTSNWAFRNTTKSPIAEFHQLHDRTMHCRPTAVFSYDWRRSIPELSVEFHQFCEEKFPGKPVQVLAHSLGGLMAFTAMRSHPEKYSPGAVVVGVPFETGIQYLQDLHKGYYTELDRCRQFTPEAQFTMSSHWPFFPISKARLEDRFVDVSNRFQGDDGSISNNQNIKFDADVSGIGKFSSSFQLKIEGESAYFDFYDPDEWERMQLGIFGPEYDGKLSDSKRQAYKNHMRIQMRAAKEWREKVLGEGEDAGITSSQHTNINFPPLVVCASDKVPTVNQILRRKNWHLSTKPNKWEYDYINGRSVPGDGRIDYDRAFPPSFIDYKKVVLDSAHAKQMCWEESGGDFAKIYCEVADQIADYIDRRSVGRTETATT